MENNDHKSLEGKYRRSNSLMYSTENVKMSEQLRGRRSNSIMSSMDSLAKMQLGKLTSYRHFVLFKSG